MSDVLSSDRTLARKALPQILADRVRFMPIDLGDGSRTYRFEASLSLGRIGGGLSQNSVDVPDGIRPLLRQPIRVALTVKEAA